MFARAGPLEIGALFSAVSAVGVVGGPLAGALGAMAVGSVVFVADARGAGLPPALVGWRGDRGFVTVFAAKDDLTVLRSRLAAALGDEGA